MTTCPACLHHRASEADWELTDPGARPDLCWSTDACCNGRVDPVALLRACQSLRRAWKTAATERDQALLVVRDLGHELAEARAAKGVR